MKKVKDYFYTADHLVDELNMKKYVPYDIPEESDGWGPEISKNNEARKPLQKWMKANRMPVDWRVWTDEQKLLFKLSN